MEPLVAYRVAVVAVVTGGFSPAHAGLRYVLSAGGGIVVGLAVGYLVRLVRRRLDDPPVEITIALLTGYFAYLPAEMLDVSGVLAVVTVGVYVGWHAPELSSPQQRLQGLAVFEILVLSPKIRRGATCAGVKTYICSPAVAVARSVSSSSASCGRKINVSGE